MRSKVMGRRNQSEQFRFWLFRLGGRKGREWMTDLVKKWKKKKTQNWSSVPTKQSHPIARENFEVLLYQCKKTVLTEEAKRPHTHHPLFLSLHFPSLLSDWFHFLLTTYACKGHSFPSLTSKSGSISISLTSSSSSTTIYSTTTSFFTSHMSLYIHHISYITSYIIIYYYYYYCYHFYSLYNNNNSSSSRTGTH